MNYWWLLAGSVLLLRRSDDGIGKIVEGKPEGVTPCFDGKFSTHKPRSGVCSYHGGWKGTAAKKAKQSIEIIAPRSKATEAEIFIIDIDYETAKRAHQGTSHVPDTRGRNEVARHRSDLIKLYKYLSEGRSPDQLKALKDRWPKFVTGFTKKKLEALYSRSRVMSTNITGPANFPVRRMEKIRNAYENKSKAVEEYWQKFQRIVRSDRNIYPELLRTEAIKSGANNALADMKAKLSTLQSLHNDTLAMNRIIRKGGNVIANLEAAGYPQTGKDKSRKVFVERNGKIWPFFTNNTATRLRELKKRIVREEKLSTRRESTGERGKRFTGGEVVEAHDDNRLRILFEEIPTPEMRKTLKKNGWRWSPKNKAWQRQLTANAWRSANTILPII